MSSVIHFRFKSSKEFSSVTFDGMHIKVIDLKHLIIEKQHMGRGGNYDLIISDAQTKQKYEDDNELVPRNASVIVRRVPLAVATSGPKRHHRGREKKAAGSSRINVQADIAAEAAREQAMLTKTAGTEEEMIAALANQEGELVVAKRRHFRDAYRAANPLQAAAEKEAADKALGKDVKTKSIPAPNTKAAEAVAKVGQNAIIAPRKGAGIPASFLTSTDGEVMVYQQLAFESLRHVDVDADNKEVPPELKCLICKQLLREAMKLPCCGGNFCDGCIRDSLIQENAFQICPNCQSTGMNIDSLIPNRNLRHQVNRFKQGKYAPPRASQPNTGRYPPPAHSQHRPQHPQGHGHRRGGQQGQGRHQGQGQGRHQGQGQGRQGRQGQRGYGGGYGDRHEGRGGGRDRGGRRVDRSGDRMAGRLGDRGGRAGGGGGGGGGRGRGGEGRGGDRYRHRSRSRERDTRR